MVVQLWAEPGASELQAGASPPPPTNVSQQRYKPRQAVSPPAPLCSGVWKHAAPEQRRLQQSGISTWTGSLGGGGWPQDIHPRGHTSMAKMAVGVGAQGHLSPCLSSFQGRAEPQVPVCLRQPLPGQVHVARGVWMLAHRLRGWGRRAVWGQACSAGLRWLWAHPFCLAEQGQARERPMSSPHGHPLCPQGILVLGLRPA